MSSVVVQNVSRHQPPERCKLSSDVGESHAAAVEQQPHPTRVWAAPPAMTAVSAGFPAVSPLRALLTGEGMVPQVRYRIVVTVTSACANNQQRQYADTANFVNTVLCLAKTCPCVQMLLQQTSPQLLCLLLQLLATSSRHSDTRHEQSGTLAEVCSRML